MIPIDGEKLIRELDVVIKNGENPQRSDAFKSVIFAIQNGNYNLPSDTLIIQREEGYEKRSCSLCFFASDCCINRCGMAEEWDGECYQVQMTCEGCELQLPCKYHITDSELKAAYIVGGG